MAIEKMRLIRIAFNRDNIDDVLSTLVKSKHFHPELASQLVNEGNQGIPLADDQKYEEYLDRIKSATRSLRCELEEAGSEVDHQFTDEEIEAYLSAVEAKVNELNEKHVDTSELKDEDLQALKNLKEYDIDKLNALSQTKVKFGRFPASSIPKLALHNNDRFIYDVLNKNNHYYWILYICLEQDEAEIDKMFDSLFFEPIPIPLVDEEEIVHACEIDMMYIYGFVKKQDALYRLFKYVATFDEDLVLSGFIGVTHLEAFKEDFNQIEGIKVQDFPADAEEGLVPPTILKNKAFFKPFEMFVEMYGIPKYKEFDPTWYVTLTYCFLFGLMFADLGQGFVLLLLGLYLDKVKKMRLGAAMVRMGPFSMFFGFIFGSVFGNEELLNPVFHALGFAEKPFEVMHEVNQLLIVALVIGVVLILGAIFYNIVEKIKQKRYGEALFDQNGVAGFIFYGTVILGFGLEMLLGIKLLNPIVIALMIVLPLFIILFKHPLQHLIEKKQVKPHAGWGSYLIESFFEVFEVLLSFVSNTMSYLRVGGFVLSHAGMMLVVNVLMAQAGAGGGIIVAVVGNIFVMALEGMVVGIQTLRLEYYEMFSRYYEGGGKKFNPVSMGDQ